MRKFILNLKVAFKGFRGQILFLHFLQMYLTKNIVIPRKFDKIRFK